MNYVNFIFIFIFCFSLLLPLFSFLFFFLGTTGEKSYKKGHGHFHIGGFKGREDFGILASMKGSHFYGVRFL